MDPGIKTTIFLILLIAVAAAAAWALTRGVALLGKKRSAPAPPPSAPPLDAGIPQPPLMAAAPPPYPGATAQSPPPPPAAMPITQPAPARPPAVRAEEYSVLEGRLGEVEALLDRLALQGQVPAPAPAPADFAPPETPPRQQVRGEVYRLADEGMPGTTIAQRLALSRSEVELLLELRRLRGAVAETNEGS
ncbi:MAG: hypothetical protein ACYC6A_09550 [Armatimonadota bacterium]